RRHPHDSRRGYCAPCWTSSRPTLTLGSWLLQAALALRVVLQQVLVSVGELHELSHGAAGGHDISETGAPDEEGNAAGTLHVMHHLAHCCGHVVPTPAAPLVLPRISHSEPTNLTDSRLVPSGRWLAPFRPPISA